MKVIRVNWIPNEKKELGKYYSCYVLDLSDEDFKTIYSVLNDTKIYYEVSEYKLGPNEVNSDFNKDLVFHYFGLDICYG